MPRTLLSTGLAVAVLLTGSASGQTVDEVIAKNVQARGGLEALKGVRSVRMVGTIRQGASLELPFTLEGLRPNRRRIEFTLEGMTGVQAYDGTTAWAMIPFAGRPDPEPLPPEMAREAEEEADLDGPLVEPQAKGHTVELMGAETLDGARVHKLKLTLKGGAVRYVYVDAESGLELKVEGARRLRGVETAFETLLSDYRPVGGLMIPHAIEQGTPGASERQHIVISEVELNVPLDEARFSMPSRSRKAPASDR